MAFIVDHHKTPQDLRRLVRIEGDSKRRGTSAPSNGLTPAGGLGAMAATIAACSDASS
ncbi:MAG TPA: hypothetical protein VFU43_02280 [Streptosporangiaceae bacterium]|nr:hypothetical protein [Streptosporangiaceae bacterium]